MNDRFHTRNVPAARDLRIRETSAEALLWQALRNRRIDGYKFRRQHPVGPFVVDFCCLERGFAIELDGEIHNHQQERDAERDAFLAAHGLQILRIPNAEVQQEFSHVLAMIRAALREAPPARPGRPRRVSGH